MTLAGKAKTNRNERQLHLTALRREAAAPNVAARDVRLELHEQVKLRERRVADLESTEKSRCAVGG